MAIHCEKLVKRLMDKHFKPTTVSVNKSTSKFFFIIFYNQEKAPIHESKSENFPDEEELDDADIGEVLNLQEKIAITDKIRKLTNEGLAAVYLI